VSFPNKETQFKKGQSGNPNGRPKGAISLAARIRDILARNEGLPVRIEKTIKNALGEGKTPIDAVVIVALLQALQGDKQWAESLSNNGCGKPVETLRHEGGDPTAR
jgi:hypothetical protein